VVRANIPGSLLGSMRRNIETRAVRRSGWIDGKSAQDD
jgi:hypothetical protein